jgi:hypothetical protein
MEQTESSVNDYITELKKNPIIKSVCDLTQTVGGFDVNTTDETKLEYLQVDNVYKRLGVLAQNNLVAVSELIKDVPGNVVYNGTGIVPTNICGCETDTGFVMIPKKYQKYPDHIRVESVGTGANIIKIASIHLPGDGPKTLKDKKNDADKSIAAFLRNNLESIADKDVDVVCGDTNITVAKSLNEDDKDNREQAICKYFYTFFKGPCLVLMSNIQVGKHRRGFMLRNQQLKKSVPESHTESEADGTIMAIKLSRDVTIEIIKQLQVSLGQHITCVYKLNDSEELTLISKTYETVAALQFIRPIESCVDTDGKPTEKVWLDHSVLYVPFTNLCSLTGKTDATEKYPRNLIVVNMGSIVNSGKKNWNTQYISKSKEIKDADMEIYNLIRASNPAKGLPKYEDIIGSEMTKDKIGVDKTMITYDDKLTLSIEAIAKELYEELTGKRMQSGGNYKTKRRLNRRSNLRSNTKHNTKTKKRTQNRYKRCY